MKKVDNYFLYLSGVISENQYYESPMNMVHGDEDLHDEDDAMDLPDFKKLMNRLTIKLGEKANTYAPLLRYIARNKHMLPMFEELIEDATKLQASVGRRIFK